MNGQSKPFGIRFNSVTGKMGLVMGALLFPFLFENIFAVGPLRAVEWTYLVYFSLVLMTFSAGLLYWKGSLPSSITLLFFTFLLLIGIELTARLSLKVFASSGTLRELRDQCNWTYLDSSAYTGHPFLQFTGRPAVTMKGTDAHGSRTPFNNYGFVGKDFRLEKTAGVMRIACLGESTTEDGYPAFLQDYLNRSGKRKFETLNFGHAYWTTAHSLVNFMLNVQDFHPDCIVIHHGWNEERVRHSRPEDFRSDYSHAFKTFSAPRMVDRYPIRWSVIYRWIKFRMDPNPKWTSLSAYIHPDKKDLDNGYKDTTELQPFRRNLENIIDLALARGMKVVLTTLPHSTDPAAALYFGYPSIDQCNVINRELAQQFAGRISFVDLDSMITGKHNEIFKDLGHINDAGRTMKAEAIGKVILEMQPASPAQ